MIFSEVITLAKEVVFAPVSVCWLVGLSAGLHRNHWKDFRETRMEGGSLPRTDHVRISNTINQQASKMIIIGICQIVIINIIGPELHDWHIPTTLGYFSWKRVDTWFWR